MEETIIRKVLKNEFTQVIGIAVGVWFFVTTVILPIANIQFSLTNIQNTLADFKSTSTNLDSRITQNSDDLITLKERLARYNIK